MKFQYINDPEWWFSSILIGFFFLIVGFFLTNYLSAFIERKRMRQKLYLEKLTTEDNLLINKLQANSVLRDQYSRQINSELHGNTVNEITIVLSFVFMILLLLMRQFTDEEIWKAIVSVLFMMSSLGGMIITVIARKQRRRIKKMNEILEKAELNSDLN